jgi:hypothetical protein
VTRNIFQAVTILFLSAAALTAAPAERWIHVRVESARGVRGNVSISLPIEMASAVLPSVPADPQHRSSSNAAVSANSCTLPPGVAARPTYEWLIQQRVNLNPA